jgi:hypothetical protein
MFGLVHGLIGRLHDPLSRGVEIHVHYGDADTQTTMPATEAITTMIAGMATKMLDNRRMESERPVNALPPVPAEQSLHPPDVSLLYFYTIASK